MLFTEVIAAYCENHTRQYTFCGHDAELLVLNLVVHILTTWLVDTVQTMKAYGGCSGIAPLILNLGTRCMWVVKSTPLSLHHRRKNASTHGTGGWVAPRVGPDVSEKKKIS